MIIKISKMLSLCCAGALALCSSLQAADRADQASLTSKIEDFASSTVSKLYVPRALKSTQETLAAAYDKAYDALALYFKEAGNLAEKEAQRVVDDVVGYPAFIGEAAREEYLQRHTEELEKASSEEKQEILDTADGIATIGRLLSVGNALVAAIVPSAVFGKWGDGASLLLQSMSKSSLGLILSPLLVSASYYLGSTAYRAYLHLANTYADVLDKVDAGTLSEAEAKQAQAQMLDAIKVLEAESKKNELP